MMYRPHGNCYHVAVQPQILYVNKSNPSVSMLPSNNAIVILHTHTMESVNVLTSSVPSLSITILIHTHSVLAFMDGTRLQNRFRFNV